MSTLSEFILIAPQRNPLLWAGLVVTGLILLIFLGSDRNGLERPVDKKASDQEQTASSLPNNESIDRDLPISPGMGARKIIESTRDIGKPYPLIEIFNQAQVYQTNGSLADSHLLYFFSAREGHLESIMQMALMSDPTQFSAGNSLLDQADAVQAYKWYQKAALVGYQPAIDSVKNLREWALDEAELGNAYARQLLLNLK
jgi:TPR repeat protein